ncbi:MAG: T9SS type A sorting domain-containing protein, partial [Bacteroidales bacterium]|nr:T9SS type A sorting domain-containing protein [Bacteroidales bacterium]
YFPGTYSKGIFPPENAFSLRMIPALKDEGIEWAIVDNIHFDRACNSYPFSTSGNLYEPNKADIINPNPNDWKALKDLWAGTPVSIKWGHTPHFAQYIDPATGNISKIIVVPGSRYLGNEDGRGGFGALQYEKVMSQFEELNTDPKHPILIVLPHDGDNYGGGSDGYYGSNFDGFVDWVKNNSSRFVCTTIQDYLQKFPPDENDIIHIEPGSWSGADNGDPEFKKWNGDPDKGTGYSPDRNSWGVVTAAKNYFLTAEQIDPNNANTKDAWKFLLVSETSCYWYWDNSEDGKWDSHPTRACNEAVKYAVNVTNGGNDLTPPTIYLPQREPYNPGGKEWNVAQASDFTVWSYVYDLSGLQSVQLKYRLDKDGINSLQTSDNETYSGGADVDEWLNINMDSKTIASTTNPSPTYKAAEYSAMIKGINNKLIDYYIEAKDNKGNIARSSIEHVWVGEGGGPNPQTGVYWTPANPTKDDTITITVSNASQGGKLHWGVNNETNWEKPVENYWPPNSTLFNGTGPAVQSKFNGPDASKNLTIKLGPFNNPAQNVTMIPFVINYDDNSWDNNSGKNYIITINTGTIGNVSWKPINPTTDDIIEITVSNATKGGKLHWGVNYSGSTWQKALEAYWTPGSTLFNGTGPAVESPFTGPDGDKKLKINLGPFNNPAQEVSSLAFVLHYDDNTWDNNDSKDFHIPVTKTIISNNNSTFNFQYSKLSIYPNPAKEKVWVIINLTGYENLLGLNTQLNIYDLTGKLIKTQPINNPEYLLDIKDIKPGLYFIEINSNNQILRNKLFVR